MPKYYVCAQIFMFMCSLLCLCLDLHVYVLIAMFVLRSTCLCAHCHVYVQIYMFGCYALCFYSLLSLVIPFSCVLTLI